MAKAYSYIRMSTPEQLKGDSIRRQQKATDDYISAHGLELTDIIQDHGISAFQGKNSEFGALSHFLQLAEAGLIEEGSHLIVESLDRLTRQNVFDATALLNRIIRHGINVVTLIDQRIYSKESIERNQMELMIASITMMRAHEESKTKSIRLAAAWENKRKSARNGQVTKQKIPHWLIYTTDGKEIILIEERAKLINKVFELSRDGWGVYSIAKYLNDQKLPTWGRSSIWQESYLKKLLHNRALLGEYQPYKLFTDSKKRRVADGPVIRDYYPKVIDEVLFSDAKESIAKRRISGKGRKGTNFPNLFTGILKCIRCGTGIRYLDKGPLPKGGQYLRCSRAVLTSECGAENMRYSIVEQQLINMLREVNYNTIMNGLEWEAEIKKLKSLRLKNEKRVDVLNTEATRIADAIAIMPDSKDLLNKLRLLDIERQELTYSSKNISSQLAELGKSSVSQASELLKKLNEDALKADERIHLRKKVSGEIRRFIKAIKIAPSDHFPWEESDDSLEQSDMLNLEIEIVYRSGSWQIYNRRDGINTYAKGSTQHKLMVNRKEIQDLK